MSWKSTKRKITENSPKGLMEIIFFPCKLEVGVPNILIVPRIFINYCRKRWAFFFLCVCFVFFSVFFLNLNSRNISSLNNEHRPTVWAGYSFCCRTIDVGDGFKWTRENLCGDKGKVSKSLKRKKWVKVAKSYF